MKNEEIVAQLKEICNDLNLPFDLLDVQDWGIIHADALRTEEFLNYYHEKSLNQAIQHYVFELIVASYNDAILIGVNNSYIEKSFLSVIDQSCDPMSLLIKEYWQNIVSKDEFPVGYVINKHMKCD